MTEQHSETAGAELRGRYQAHIRWKFLLILLMFGLLCVLCVAGLSVGGASYSFAESWEALLAGHPQRGVDAPVRHRIIWTLRAPRVLMGAVSGVGLAVSGLMMQTILRNPLASPYTLGISAAASFGAALGIISKFSVLVFLFPVDLRQDLIIITNSFIFTVLCTFLIYFLSKLNRITAETVALFGVAMMYVFEAATSFMQYIGNPEELAELVYWIFGSMSKASWIKLRITAVCVGICVAAAYRQAWNFNALMLGDESAQSIGVGVERLRIFGLLLSSLMTAVIVSLLGPIGFIGLVAPHIGRMVAGGDHRFLIPVTCIAGGILLVFADILSSVILAPAILPIGIMTSFVGVPLLIYLIAKRKKEHW
ncbi:MAG: iron ABC transporter permease [Spirochaetaceae bacterium]|nr:iron ABC transporter permease [Spirochaetaceae bacterium]